METAMMVAEPVPHSCSGGGGGGGSRVRPTSLRSHSAPSINGGGVDSMDNGQKNAGSRTGAIATAASPSPSRRVTFPVAEVTGIVEPPNPWKKAADITSTDAIVAYAAACDRYHVRPLDKVIQQVKKIDNFEKRCSSLNLQGEELGAGQIEALEEIFKRIQFDTINLEGASLDEQSATALFDMIEYYESVQHLIISGNKTSFTLREWQGLCRMIKSTRCLGELEMAGIAIGDNINILARTLRTCSNLASLHLDNCSLSGKYFTILMNGLVNSSIRELYVANNRLSATDAIQVGSHLGKNTMLKLLHLGNNHLQDDGMAHIANGMCEQPSSVYRQSGLSTLIVRSNRLSNESTRHLARIISDCPELTALDVSFNNLNNEFVHGVKDPLIRNRTLTNLCLRGCRITCVGAVALAEYVADSSSIELLDLRENDIKIGGLMALTHSMEVNRSVSRLDLDGASVEDDSVDDRRTLLLEIDAYCERNHEIGERWLAAAADAAAKGDETSSSSSVNDEVLSVPVTRLLSLWSNRPTEGNDRPTVDGSPPPIVLSSITETSTANPSNVAGVRQTMRGTSHFLRSPQPSPACSPVPSPTKNRFRVTRVFQDADSASASRNSVVGEAGASSKHRCGGRFDKFTVTPVRTIDGVVVTNGPVQRKSDSDLLVSSSSSDAVCPSSIDPATRDAGRDRQTETISTATEDEDSNALYGVGPGEEEGEDSVFLDVPPVGPNQRVRHDSMRVHRRRLSNGGGSDDLGKLQQQTTLEPLSSDGTADDGPSEDVASPDEGEDGRARPPEKFGLQNAVDSLEIGSLKAGFLKDQLESMSPSFESVEGTMGCGDDDSNKKVRFESDDDEDDPSSGADRDSGIYLLDANADDTLGTPCDGERLEEVKSSYEEESNERSDDDVDRLQREEEGDRTTRSSGGDVREEPMDLAIFGQATSSDDDDDDGTSPSVVAFNLVDIDEHGGYTTGREYASSWVVTTTTEGRVQSVVPEGDASFFGCSSSNSPVDLLTGSESEEWCSRAIVTARLLGEDLMLFTEKDASNMDVAKVDGCGGGRVGDPNENEVGAWMARTTWNGDEPESTRPKHVEDPLQRIVPCGSESSNSSDSGVPESPISCSPPVVDLSSTASSPGRRKAAAVLTANRVSLGLDVLERLDRKAVAMPVSSGRSRGMIDVAAEFLLSRDRLDGAAENRREATSSGCLGLSNPSSPTTVSHRGIANETATATTNM